ncbi:MAG TPA: hypothetical protein P5295_20365 [Spirochaetota bacterium]|nr:hypothetical protein [Spirochaetota bacterium]
MNKTRIAVFTVMLLAIALPAALGALPFADIKFENRSLSYKGEAVEKLFITFGNTSVGIAASDIQEMAFSPKDSTMTVILKSQVYVIGLQYIRAIVIDKGKSYIELKL